MSAGSDSVQYRSAVFSSVRQCSAVFSNIQKEYLVIKLASQIYNQPSNLILYLHNVVKERGHTTA